jgi:hypothetical protein
MVRFTHDMCTPVITTLPHLWVDSGTTSAVQTQAYLLGCVGVCDFAVDVYSALALLCVLSCVADTAPKAADVSLQGWAQQEEQGEPRNAAAGPAAGAEAAGKIKTC